MHDFILDNIIPLYIYLMLGILWIVWLYCRDFSPINLDKPLIIIFFGHLVVSVLVYAFYIIGVLLRDLTPTRLKTWLFEEWK